MTLVVAGVHQFRGYWSDGGVCEIEIYTAPGLPPLVVATELPENTNTSITNLAEYVAAEVMERYLTTEQLAEHDPPLIWVERYRRSLTPVMRGRRVDEHEDWSLVTFEHYRREPTRTFSRSPAWRYRIGDPSWVSLKRSAFDALLAPYLGGEHAG